MPGRPFLSTCAKKIQLPGENWNLGRINPLQDEMLGRLGLLPAAGALPKRKRGLPRKWGYEAAYLKNAHS